MILFLVGLLILVGGALTWWVMTPPYLDVYLYNEVPPGRDPNDPDTKMTHRAYTYLKRFPNTSVAALNEIMNRRQVEEQIADWKILHPGKKFRGIRYWRTR